MKQLVEMNVKDYSKRLFENVLEYLWYSLAPLC